MEGNFAVGFQTPPDRRAVVTVTTDGYETNRYKGLVPRLPRSFCRYKYSRPLAEECICQMESPANTGMMACSAGLQNSGPDRSFVGVADPGAIGGIGRQKLTGSAVSTK